MIRRTYSRERYLADLATLPPAPGLRRVLDAAVTAALVLEDAAPPSAPPPASGIVPRRATPAGGFVAAAGTAAAPVTSAVLAAVGLGPRPSARGALRCHWLALALAVLATLAALPGCTGVITDPTSDLPMRYSVDPAFNAAQVRAIDAAAVAWCDAVGYCPARADWTGPDARGAVVLADVAAYPAHRPDDEAACNDPVSQRILVRASRDDMLGDVNGFRSVMLHEWGHYGIDGHLSSGLMTSWIADPPVVVIDDAALAAWGGGAW